MNALQDQCVRVSAIVILSMVDRGIGEKNRLLWNIPEDLKRFKQLTTGNAIVMGRKTFQSILGYLNGPLPNRINIVVTRDTNYAYKHENVLVAHSIEQALEKGREFGVKEIFIGGGEEIYKQALPYTNRLYLTLVDDQKKADSYFPPYEEIFLKKIFEEKHTTKNGLRYSYVVLEK